jgi:hypothetical protein
MSDTAAVAAATPPSANSTDTTNLNATAQTTETTEEVVDEGSDLVADTVTEAQKAAEKSLKRKYKLKVDGEEFEEEFDLGDDESIKKHLQMSKAAQKRMQEKSQIEKDMRQLLEILKTDPDSVLQELGIDPDEHAKKRLQRKLDEMQKSPEQKEKEKFEAELKASREESANLKKEKEEADFLRMQEKYRQEFDKELDTALSSDPDLPKNAYVIKRITDLMIFAMENKMPNVKMKDIIPIVKQEIYTEWNQMFDNFSEDQLEKAWGKKNIDRVRKALMKRQKQAPVTPAQVVQTGKAEVSAQEKPKEAISMKNFFKTIGSK